MPNALRGISTRRFLPNTMRNTLDVLCVTVLCFAVQLGCCGDVGPGGLGPGDLGGLGGFGGLGGADGPGLGGGFGDGFGAGPLGLAAPGAALAVPLATTVSFVRQPFIRVGYVTRPVVTYVHQPVATVSHTIRPVVSLGQALVGSNVPLAGAGPVSGGLKGAHYGWKK
ncbi:shematrin-like protein 2 [Dermacentor silvarum]|uniref:shematrin-like protein 2 n=1 Tax=Dermacentor silvarum TaxID=543639 RepID=UPI00189C0FF5|nr:shematrin-like protein 2 [Dermacentor silvarum]